MNMYLKFIYLLQYVDEKNWKIYIYIGSKINFVIIRCYFRGKRCVSIEGIFLISLPYLDFEGNKKIDTHFSSLASQFLKQYRYTGRR